MTYNTAQKIKSLYAGREDIDHRNSKEAVTQTIKLLTSGGLGSAWVYTGTTKSYTTIDGMIALRPNTKTRIYAIIYVTYGDMYQIDFVQIKNDKAERYCTSGEVFFEDLADTYENMYDAYIKAMQNDFIELRL